MDGTDLAIIIAKVLVVFGFLLGAVQLLIWAERRIVARMQQRIGPNRVGPFGILQSLADGVKLFFKEDIRPAAADRTVYALAPLAAVIPAVLTVSVVPFGDAVTIGDRVVHLQIADLNVGILWFLAMGSLMVYGTVLAGWSSGSTYPLLGGVRSSAQMISYEMAMSLAVVSVVLSAGTLSTRELVEAQAGTWFGIVPAWFLLPQLPAFIVFLLAAFAETNRAPFDLPEAETELVGGYHTEYSGLKFAMFFLAEYIHIVTMSAIAVTLFLGGWQGPRLPIFEPVWPVVWFLAKTGLVIFLFVWVRATLPRFRYDRLMALSWKRLVPFMFVWVMVTGLLVVLPQEVDRLTVAAWTGIAFGIALVVWLVRLTVARLPEIRGGLRAPEGAGKGEG